jgi:hypothetical protein
VEVLRILLSEEPQERQAPLTSQVRQSYTQNLQARSMKLEKYLNGQVVTQVLLSMLYHPTAQKLQAVGELHSWQSAEHLPAI